MFLFFLLPSAFNPLLPLPAPPFSHTWSSFILYRSPSLSIRRHKRTNPFVSAYLLSPLPALSVRGAGTSVDDQISRPHPALSVELRRATSLTGRLHSGLFSLCRSPEPPCTTINCQLQVFFSRYTGPNTHATLASSPSSSTVLDVPRHLNCDAFRNLVPVVDPSSTHPRKTSECG